MTTATGTGAGAWIPIVISSVVGVVMLMAVVMTLALLGYGCYRKREFCDGMEI